MKNSAPPAIRYSQSWEDADILLEALSVSEKDRVLSITSGGCNSLAILSRSPESLLCVDVNPAQQYLFELKRVAAKKLEQHELLEFLGVLPSPDRKKVFVNLAKELHPDARNYWEQNGKELEKGVIHAGRFEKYLQLFRRRFLPLIHANKTIQDLLKEKSVEAQRDFYRNSWENIRWKLFFTFFFSESLMRLLGRSPEMFHYSTARNISQHYLEKTRQAFCSEVLFRNCHINYILRGNYFEALPRYLHTDSLQSIKRSGTHIRLQTKALDEVLETLPENSISAFNLSDVFEPASEEDTVKIFSEIKRVGCNGARMVFWNNLVKRDVPSSFHGRFKEDRSLEEKLAAQQKVFFYNALKIYTLVK